MRDTDVVRVGMKKKLRPRRLTLPKSDPIPEKYLENMARRIAEDEDREILEWLQKEIDKELQR